MSALRGVSAFTGIAFFHGEDGAAVVVVDHGDDETWIIDG
jgi:hypothetical protein